MIKFDKAMSLIKCFIFGHEIDWDEYERRLESEEHHTSGVFLYCKCCKKYNRLRGA